ncbi:MAG: hypothetical protein ABII90_10290 [Bacteroidota bacterium]
MSKRISTSITLLILISMNFTSCKKYPEGPLISLRTPEKRLIGTWEIKEFEIDGQDFLDSLKNHPAYCLYSFHYGMSIGIELSSLVCIGKMDFENKKKELCFPCYGNTVTAYGPLAYENICWDILRLTNKEMKLSTDFTDGKEYVVSFDKIDE